MSDDAPALQCPIGVFAAREAEIRRLTAALNAAATPADKAAAAEALRDAAERLLACPARAADDSNCGLCGAFSRLRANTAGLILRLTRRAP